METSSTIYKMMLVFSVMAFVATVLYGCEIHAHPLSPPHRYVYDGWRTVYYVCDDPEIEPFSYAPFSCDEYYDGICCDWKVTDYHYDTYCLWEDSCRWEFAGTGYF